MKLLLRINYFLLKTKTTLYWFLNPSARSKPLAVFRGRKSDAKVARSGADAVQPDDVQPAGVVRQLPDGQHDLCRTRRGRSRHVHRRFGRSSGVRGSLAEQLETVRSDQLGQGSVRRARQSDRLHVCVRLRRMDQRPHREKLTASYCLSSNRLQRRWLKWGTAYGSADLAKALRP